MNQSNENIDEPEIISEVITDENAQPQTKPKSHLKLYVFVCLALGVGGWFFWVNSPLTTQLKNQWLQKSEPVSEVEQPYFPAQTAEQENEPVVAEPEEPVTQTPLFDKSHEISSDIPDEDVKQPIQSTELTDLSLIIQQLQQEVTVLHQTVKHAHPATPAIQTTN